MQRYDPTTALIVVDLQNDFADPAGGLSVAGGSRIVPRINTEIEAAKAAGAGIFYTQDWHPESTPHFAKDGGIWPVHCVADTWGAELHPDLIVDGPIVRKGANGEDGYSGFTMRDPTTGETKSTELEGLVRERSITRLFVCGLATDYCVNATAIDANGSGSRHPCWPTSACRSTSVPATTCGPSNRCSRPASTSSGPRPDRVQLHLVDATYELFRAHYAPRPPVLGRDGIVLSGVSGLVEQLLYLLREEGATHVGCATDRVIESFRNDLFPGYKSSFGMPADLLDQFPIAEAAVEALGIVLWPMVEFEADDAIAAAATRWADDEAVDKIVICTPDKDMAQLVRDERIVLWDRRRQIVYDEPGVLTKWGVSPASIPDWLALVGDSADGFPGLPGWGTKSAAAVLRRYGHLEMIPRRGSEWDVPSLRGAVTLAATLTEQWDAAQLYRSLALLRTADDGVDIPQQQPDELRWDGAPKERWHAFCDEWGLPRLRDRPHRWLD